MQRSGPIHHPKFPFPIVYQRIPWDTKMDGSMGLGFVNRDP